MYMKRLAFLGLIFLSFALFGVQNAHAATISQLDDSAITSANHGVPNQWFEKGVLNGKFVSFSFKHQRDSAWGSYSLFINECEELNRGSCYYEGWHQSITYKPKATGPEPRVDTWYASDFSRPIVFESDKVYRFLLYQVDGKIYGSTDPDSHPNSHFCDGANYPSDCFENADTLADMYFELVTDETALDPVVIVPGIMGSSLNRVSDGEEVWPNGSEMLLSRTDSYLDELVLDNSGEQIAENDMNPTAVIDSVLTRTAYGNLVDNFTDQGYASGTTLFTVPYDWRLDVADEVNRLDVTIQKAITSSPSGKINIIAHSMGGLLVKEYLNNLEDTSFVDKLIIAGVPQLGAPKAFKAIVYGDNMGFDAFGADILNPKRVSVISKNMPGVYELLPTERYINTVGGYIQDFRDGGSQALDYSETHNLLEDNGANPNMFNITDQFHSSLDNESFNASNVHNIMGCRNPKTIGLFRIYDDKIKISPVDGDGTVPLISSINLSSNYTNYFAMDLILNDMNHVDLIRRNEPLQLIADIINDQEPNLPPNISTSLSDCLDRHLVEPDIDPDDIIETLYISTHSPVELHIYDNQGNHVGHSPEGDIDLQIPESNYEIIGHNNFAILPNGNYEIVVDATGAGEFDLEIETYTNLLPTNKVTYIDVSVVSDSSVASLDYTGSTGDLTLNLDSDGNGTTDQQIQPNAVLDENSAGDITPPDISFNMANEVLLNAQVVMDFTVTDDLSGVEIVEADLNGVFVNAGDIVVVSEIGEYTLTVMAVDRAGNTRTSEFTFNAAYDFGGFLPPIGKGKQEYNVKQMLPVKFQLVDYNGNFVDSAEVTLFAEGTDVGGVFRYDTENQQYVFNLDLSLLGTGPWMLHVELGDGNSYKTEISVGG